MRELCLTLEFACHTCAGTVAADVTCTGSGLWDKDPFAAVAIGCPTCRSRHDLVFDMDGVIHWVALCERGQPVAEPSLN